jgi:protein ImuB
MAPIPGGPAPPSAGAAGDIDGLADFLEMLRRWGLATLGELAALPPVDLFERAGTRGLAWQGMARGEDARPLVCTRDEPPYEASQAFEWPIETLDPLAFAISRLLEPLTSPARSSARPRSR